MTEVQHGANPTFRHQITCDGYELKIVGYHTTDPDSHAVRGEAAFPGHPPGHGLRCIQPCHRVTGGALLLASVISGTLVFGPSAAFLPGAAFTVAAAIGSIVNWPILRYKASR